MKRQEARIKGLAARGETRHEVVKSLVSSRQKLEAKGIEQVAWDKTRKYKAKKENVEKTKRRDSKGQERAKRH